MSRAGRRLAAAVALALLAGCAPSDARQPAPRQAGDTGAQVVRDFRSTRGYRATPEPVRLEIPRIGVRTALERLGQARDHTIQSPSRWEVAGWYAAGPRPGDPGSAVILGHVDSTSGPAVFFRLRELRAGDRIEVARADGSSARFAVQRISQYDKRRFQTDEVYYPTLTPMLRLVTCGGEFDRAAGHYRSNVIVFATLAPGGSP